MVLNEFELFKGVGGLLLKGKKIIQKYQRKRKFGFQ
jgi:hypothetical protein